MSGVVKSVAAGAGTGAIDNSLRQVAESAADALKADDTAVEAMTRVGRDFQPGQVADAGLTGALVQLPAEAVATGAGKLAEHGIEMGRKSFTPLAQSGLKSTPTGLAQKTPKLLSKELEADAAGMPAQDLVVEQTAKPMLRQRQHEMETSKAKNEVQMEQARDELSGVRVPLTGIKQQIRDRIRGMMRDDESTAVATPKPGEPPQRRRVPVSSLEESKVSELRRFEQSLPEEATLQDLEVIERHLTDKVRNPKGDILDEDWQQVERDLLSARDQFPPTATTKDVLMGHRSDTGETSIRRGIAGLKSRQQLDMNKMQTENEGMGLPTKVKWRPKDMTGPDELEGTWDPGEPPASFTNKLGEDRPMPAIRRLAERAGLDTDFETLAQLRASDNFEGRIGPLISGLGVGTSGGAGTYLKPSMLTRTIPVLHSIYGRLDRRPGGPTRIEATPEAVSIIDRFLDTYADASGKQRVLQPRPPGTLAEAAKKPGLKEKARPLSRLSTMAFGKFRHGGAFFPENEALNLRGGQAAKLASPAQHEETASDQPLTEEEALWAAKVLKAFLENERQKGN